MIFCRLLLAVGTLVLGAEYLNADSLPKGLLEGRRHQDEILQNVLPILASQHYAGRIYCATACKATDGTPLPFPRIEMIAPSSTRSPVQAIRDVFRNDERVKVSEGSARLIKITIERPLLDILQTKIRAVNFDARDQYNPALAIIAIANTKEVENAKAALGFEEPLTFTDMGVTEPEAGLPHLPKRLNDVTVDEALDTIATTFHGIIIYRVCANADNRHLFTLDFVAEKDVK